jgi:photosystem II stability/assembly factor-like uncharacterized protein
MATTKRKRGAPTPRVQHPKKAAPERRLSARALWIAGTMSLVLAAGVGLVVWLAGGGDGGQTAGSSFTRAEASLPNTPDYHSLLVSPADPQRIWLGTHVGLHESTDGGRSWTEVGLDGQDAMNLARIKRSATVWVAGHNVLAKSTDGGASWTDVQPQGLPSLDVHGFAADPRDPRRLWAAVAGQGLFRSTDSGRTFSLASQRVGPGVMALAVNPAGQVLAGEMEQGLMVSDDEGRTWRNVLGEGVMGLAVNPRTPRRVLATSGSGISLSTDSGATWRLVAPIESGAGPVAWASSRPNVGYVVGFDRVLYKTADGGASWRTV